MQRGGGRCDRLDVFRMARVGLATERVEVERGCKRDVREGVVVLCVVKDGGNVRSRGFGGLCVADVASVLLVAVRVLEEQRRTLSFAGTRTVGVDVRVGHVATRC